MGGMVSTGLAVVLGMLAMVQGCDEAREGGWLWRVLLGARGKALGGGNGALFRSSAEGATDVDVRRGPEVMPSWQGPKLWIEISKPWRQAMVLSWHSLP